jgi:hypothetical protein
VQLRNPRPFTPSSLPLGVKMDGRHRIIRPSAKAINTRLPSDKALSFWFRRIPEPGGAAAVARDDLFGMSDIVMLHLPLTAETSNLLRAAFGVAPHIGASD